MQEDDKLAPMRHSLAHLLAAAVLELYPHAKPAIGPAIENGFYYDFDFGDEQPSEDDLGKLEEKMREILKSWDAFDAQSVTPDEAKKRFEANPYKLELIDEIAERGDELTLYSSGDFTDLCRGGHAESAKDIDPKGFTLTHLAGAYWRGDENNKMLTRIYGAAFSTKDELDAYLEKREEAKKRDHRKLGRELDLFTFSELVGSGLPLFTPRGTFLRDQLQGYLREISSKYGMQPVTIPHIAKRELYETSGHAAKFGDELLKVISHYDEFVMKPVNCPHHTQIYASQPRSYRDLPVRYMESTMQYRDEKPGEIGGLTRVRAITVDDGHIFCTVDQIRQEAENIARIIEEFYTGIGLWGNHWVSLSVRDPKTPDAYIGDDADWVRAETMLQELSDDLSLDAKRIEGEAAIYGPKLDYMFKDSLGREWQLGTIQIDFAMPKRFGLEYTERDGSKQHPVMIHRAILGSYERFLAILVEHFAGAFPLWLSPVQVKVLPIAAGHRDHASEVVSTLKEHGIRAILDESNETLGKKIRQAKTEKTPYSLVIGDKEAESKTVALESRDGESEKNVSVEALVERLEKEITERR